MSDNPKRYFIVEHLTRGVLVEFVDTGKPRFSWSIQRNKGWLFDTRNDAQRRILQIEDKRVRERCRVEGPFRRR